MMQEASADIQTPSTLTSGKRASMQLVQVTEDQFESSGPRTVTHIPTGGRFSTYNYHQLPRQIVVIASYQRDRDVEGNEYSGPDIEHAARWLLIRKLQEAGIKP